MESFKVKVNPEVLKWSIQTMNIPEDKIIKSVQINENILNERLYKDGGPIYVQLQGKYINNYEEIKKMLFYNTQYCVCVIR